MTRSDIKSNTIHHQSTVVVPKAMDDTYFCKKKLIQLKKFAKLKRILKTNRNY